MKKNEYRCSGCNEIKKSTNRIAVAWFRTKKTQTKNSWKQYMCRKCVASQAPEETGRALNIRLNWTRY